MSGSLTGRVTDLKQLVESGAVTKEDFELFSDALLSLGRVAPAPRLYHSDFLRNRGNVLVDQDYRVKGVIDWELAGSGFGLPEELATALYVSYRNGEPTLERDAMLEALLRGYGLSVQTYQTEYSQLVNLLVLKIALGKICRYVRMDQEGLLTGAWQIAFFDRAKALAQSGLAALGEEREAA